MTVTARTGELIRHTDTVEIAAGQGTLPQGVVVTLTAAHRVVEKCASDTALPAGVLLHDAAAGEKATVCDDGQVLGRAGATYVIAVELTVNSDGEFITATSGDRVMGKAIEAATGANELFAVDYFKAGYIKA